MLCIAVSNYSHPVRGSRVVKNATHDHIGGGLSNDVGQN